MHKPPLAPSSVASRLVPSGIHRFAPLSVFRLAILLLVLAYPVVVYYDAIFKNAYNFPYEDDLNSTLSFLIEFTSEKASFWEKFKLVFSQYNEHRIVFDRMAFLLDYALFSHINFTHLIVIGNVAPLLIGFLFYRVLPPALPLPRRLSYLLPVAYTLFSFQYWELSTWSMAALQNLFVIVFALTSLYKLSQPSRTAFIIACLTAVGATYTSGNGLFTFVAGAAQLLILTSYRRLAVWLGVGVVAVGLYFTGYMRPPYHPDITDSLVNHTGRALSYLFTLLGSMIGPGHPKVALLIGVASLLVTVGLVGYLWYKQRLIANLPLIGWLFFLLLTCLSLMASRSGMGIGQAYTPRYGIVVVVLFATQAILFLTTITHLPLRFVVLTLYTLGSVYFYSSATNQTNRHRLDDRTRQMRYNTALYQLDPTLISVHWGNQAIGRSILDEAIRKNIYQVPLLSLRDLASQPILFETTPLADTHSITSTVKPYQTDDYLVIYRAWALLNQSWPSSVNVQLIATSSGASYRFEAHKHFWDDPSDFTLGQTYAHPGFSAVIDKQTLQPGRYRLWLCLTDKGIKAYQPLAITFNR